MTATRVALALIAVAAAALLWWATPWGLGLEGDSADYVSMARQLAANELPRFDAAGGRRLAMTQFPPGYPLVLSLGPRAGVDVLAFARVLHCVLLAATVWLVGALALRHTRSPPIGLAAAGYVAVSPQVQLVFASLMSEALFVPLVLAGATFSLSRVATRTRSGSGRSHEQRPDLGRVATRLREGAGATRRHLSDRQIVEVLALASAVLCRYAGVFFVVALCAARLTGRSPRRVSKGAKAVALAALALAPAAAWSLWLRHVGAEPSRVVRWHPPALAALRRSLSAAGGWVVPADVGGVATALAGAAVAVMLLWTVGRRLKRPRRADSAAGGWATLLVGYAAGLWLSRFALDDLMPMGVRLWLPAMPLAVLLAADAVKRAARRHRPLVALAAAAVIALSFAATLRQASTLRRDGIGYAAPQWARSPALDFVRSLPPGLPVVSNAADAVTLLLGRDAAPLPMTLFRTSGDDNVRWRDQLRSQGKAMRAGGGVIVFFDAVDRRDFLVRERQLRDVLRVEPAAILEDGRAYRVTGVR